MNTYTDMPSALLAEEHRRLKEEYKTYLEQHLTLNMARGKPAPEQLDLSLPMLDIVNSTTDCHAKNGIDCRNYGELTGIPEAKKLFADYLAVSTEEIIVTGSSSLNFMYDCLARAMLTGVYGSEKPWSRYDKIKFLCPVPGYDRHFSLCQFLGIEMIPVPMNSNGPDMDLIEALISDDDRIKGIWCVPKYSNPSGICYSNETIKRLAGLKPAAGDFRIFCDNAYAFHHLGQDQDVLNILEECKKSGNSDMVYLFGSTNKITFPGSGIAFFAASKENVDFTKKQLSQQAIGWDKLNMLRHVRYLKNIQGIKELMNQHAALLKPKFDIVINALNEHLISSGIGTFNTPSGGYFVTYQAPPGCAKRIVTLCKEAGMILTDAGATHPYGKDPDDSYIRIAPSFPSADELKTGMVLFSICTKIAFIEIISPLKRR